MEYEHMCNCVQYYHKTLTRINWIAVFLQILRNWCYIVGQLTSYCVIEYILLCT